MAFGGFMFAYSLMAGTHGMTPLRIGTSLLPPSAAFLAAFLAASTLAGRLVPSYGVTVLTAGAVLGLTWSPVVGIVLRQVPGELAGLGGGLLLTAMQAGLGFGSAVVGSIYLGGLGDGFSPTTYLLAAAMLAVSALTRQLRPRPLSGPGVQRDSRASTR